MFILKSLKQNIINIRYKLVHSIKKNRKNIACSKIFIPKMNHDVTPSPHCIDYL